MAMRALHASNAVGQSKEGNKKASIDNGLQQRRYLADVRNYNAKDDHCTNPPKEEAKPKCMLPARKLLHKVTSGFCHQICSDYRPRLCSNLLTIHELLASYLLSLPGAGNGS